MAFAKSIIFSSIWTEPPEVLKVWLTLAVMADSDGLVALSIDELARAAHLSEDVCRAALDMFRSPDPKSRTKDHEGRRIIDVDGGWRLLNHAQDRAEQLLEQRRDAHARRQREYIQRKKAKAAVPAEQRGADANDVASDQLHLDAIAYQGSADAGSAPLPPEKPPTPAASKPADEAAADPKEESLRGIIERLFVDDDEEPPQSLDHG